MSPTIDRVKEHFEQSHIYLKNRFVVNMRAEIVRELLGQVEGASILDIGCGDGSISRQFLNDTNELTMVDLATAMLDISRRNTPPDHQSRVQYINADFVDHEFHQRFDLVLCFGVLAHVESLERAVRKLAALCEPGGCCVFEYADASRTLTKINLACANLHKRLSRGHGYRTNRITQQRIAHLAEQEGLRLVDQRRYSWLLPGMRRLPHRWLRHFQSATLRNRLLSRMGMEVIAVYSKS